MRYRLPPWLLLLLLVGICGGILAVVIYLRSRSDSTAGLLRRLPAENAVVLFVDFDALRRAHVLGIFAPPALGQEPEYKAFVSQTAFDYSRDLDSALVAFHRTGTYFLLRGRFDWSALGSYVSMQGGTCHNSFCTMPGSTAERTISYFPLHAGVMAMTVSKDESAARALGGQHREARPLPAEPVWAEIPAASLKDGARLPAGTRMFARAMEGAERVVLALGPDGPRWRLRLEVDCRNAEDAQALAMQLTETTARLRDLIAREHQAPNPRDLSGVLTAGVFASDGRRVSGAWPIERGFLEALAGGSL